MSSTSDVVQSPALENSVVLKKASCQDNSSPKKNSNSQMMFETSDWNAFLNADQISRMAGAGYQDLIPLCFKELADNACDSAGSFRYGIIWDEESGNSIGGYVEDTGPGIPGNTPDEIASIFSVSRPLRSSKKIRLPTRGMLGNGLRVVSGAVHVLKGYLVVDTSGYKMTIRIDERDGVAKPFDTQRSERKGTRIEFYFAARDYRDSYYYTRWIDRVAAIATGEYTKGYLHRIGTIPTASLIWHDPHRVM